jgi:mRNA interferase RelE/StbE
VKFRVVLSREAEIVTRRLDRKNFLAVIKEIRSLESEPWPEGSSTVVGTDYLRIRVGRYRIIYMVDSKKRTVYVKRIARRNEQTYKGL